MDSEYLKTLLVCVPKALINDWYAKYETLCAMIVPRTTELIIEDQDYALFTVTLFQKTEDTFRHKCRENKFVEIIEKNNMNFILYFKDLRYEILRMMKKHLKLNVKKFEILKLKNKKFMLILFVGLKLILVKIFQHQYILKQYVFLLNLFYGRI